MSVHARREVRRGLPAWQAGAQAAGIIVAGGIILLILRAALPLMLLWQILSIIVGPGALIYFAARWRQPNGPKWRQALIEAGTLLGWDLLLVEVTLILAGIIAGRSLPQYTPAQIRAAESSAYGFSLTVFVMARVVVRLWNWWDGLRRRYLLWSLTHSLLAVIAVGAASFLALLTILSQIFQPGFILKLLPDAAFLLGSVAVAVVVLLPPFALASFLVVRRTTARLEALTNAADALRHGDLAQRVSVTGQDEVAQLQAHFNAMARDLERAQAELRNERDTVAALLRARRELIAAVSHDLRTPVATMRAYLESLTTRWQDQPSEQTTGDLDVAYHEVLHLQGLVDDLFSLARADVGKLTLRRAPLDVAALLERVVAATAPHAWQVGRVTVAAQTPPNLPRALADERRMEQILHNLVQNAVRHTPPGGLVALSATPEGNMLAVMVRDTGSGIRREDLPHIFDRYFQTASASGSRSAGGAGLGLALVKEWTEAMGGSVAVASEPGAGSCFTVRLPVC